MELVLVWVVWGLLLPVPAWLGALIFVLGCGLMIAGGWMMGDKWRLMWDARDVREAIDRCTLAQIALDEACGVCLPRQTSALDAKLKWKLEQRRKRMGIGHENAKGQATGSGQAAPIRLPDASGPSKAFM